MIILTLFHKIKSYNQFRKLTAEYRNRKNRKVVIEVHAADHCNLNCIGCSHYSPVAKPTFCDLIQMESNYKTLSKFQNVIGKINILGGEPLLNPNICKLIELTRKYFPDLNIFLLTNGLLLLNPEKLPSDFWECSKINKIQIRITQYPINVDYEAIEKICRENNLPFSVSSNKQQTLKRWNKIELSDTFLPYIKSKLFFFKKSKCIRNCMQLIGDRLYPCTVTGHVQHLNNYFGTKFKIRKGDYIEVRKIKSGKDIQKLLYTTHPFCMYHKGTVFNIPWQPSKKQVEEWTKV